MPVRAVTFDADDTIWDFQTVANIAMAEVIDRLVACRPDAAGRIDLERFARIHEAVKSRARPGTSYAQMRRDAIGALVKKATGPDPRLAEALGDLFFRIRDERVQTFEDVEAALVAIRQQLGPDGAIGIITNGNTTWSAMDIGHHFDFWLAADQVGIRKPDPRIFRLAAAAADCRPRQLLHVGDEPHSDVAGARAAGARGVFIDRRGIGTDGVTPDAEVGSLLELPGLIADWDAAEIDGIGVGPHPRPWPDDVRLDPLLLEIGDRRNVTDRYRYWRRDAIVADLDRNRHDFHVAIENWHHDLNIGSVVRNANAFGAGSVHIVGRRRWNRRGAMVTDRYQHVFHHPTIDELVGWATDLGLPLVGVDNLPNSRPIESATLPRACVLVFGQEGSGLSADARRAVTDVLSISQFGSTRSINAAVASGIAMHTWIRQHAYDANVPHQSDE